MLADVWTWRVQHGVTRPGPGGWATGPAATSCRRASTWPRSPAPGRHGWAATASTWCSVRRHPRPWWGGHRTSPGAAVRRRPAGSLTRVNGGASTSWSPRNGTSASSTRSWSRCWPTSGVRARRTPAPAGLGAGRRRAPRRGAVRGWIPCARRAALVAAPQRGGAGRHHGSRGPRRGPPGAAPDPDSCPDERPDQTRGGRCDRREGGGAVSPTRVLLHVGTPKTGTSYLQDVLFRNRERSARRTGSSTPPTGSTPTSSPRST